MRASDHRPDLITLILATLVLAVGSRPLRGPWFNRPATSQIFNDLDAGFPPAYAILRIYGLYLTALKMFLRLLASNPEADTRIVEQDEQQQNKHERKMEISDSNEIEASSPGGEDS